MIHNTAQGRTQNAERTQRHSQPASRHHVRPWRQLLVHTRTCGLSKTAKPSSLTSDPDLSSGDTPHPLRFDSTKMIWLVNWISSFMSPTRTVRYKAPLSTPPPATKKVRFRHGCALGNRLTGLGTMPDDLQASDRSSSSLL
jgi:hypothetical protein